MDSYTADDVEDLKREIEVIAQNLDALASPVEQQAVGYATLLELREIRRLLQRQAGPL